MKIYQTTQTFPPQDRYGLISQMQRSAVSVAANIAEGSGRRTLADYIRFLFIAKGSLTEVEYYIHLAQRLGYLSSESHTELNRLHRDDRWGHWMALSSLRKINVNTRADNSFDLLTWGNSLSPCCTKWWLLLKCESRTSTTKFWLATWSEFLFCKSVLLVETFLETQVIGGYNDRQTVCWHWCQW